MTDKVVGTSVSLFETEVIGTSRTFGRDSQVKVVFEGTHAGTSGDTIVFPALDHSKPLTHEQVAVGRGYVDHEAGHLRHTDMDLFQKTGRECKARGDRLALQMVNAIEDTRIEKLIIAEYPGAFKNLIATTEETAKHFVLNHAEDKKITSDLRAIGPIALTWIDRKQRGYVGEYLDKAIASLDPEVRKTVEGWVAVSRLARGLVKRTVDGRVIVDGKPGTQDSVALAKRFVGETRNPPKEKPPAPPTEGGEPEEEADEGEDGDEIESDVSDGDVPEEYEVGPGEEAGETGKLGGGGIGAGGDKDAWVDDGRDYGKEPAIDVGLDLGRAFSTHVGETGAGVGYRPFSTADDRWHYRKDAASKYAGLSRSGLSFSRARVLREREGDTTYARVLTDAGSRVSVMKRKLERALLAKALRGWEAGKEEGRLDSRRLALAVRGHTNVFKAREEVPEIDTAVEILVDLSGSMTGRKVDLAMQSAILLCEALDGTGVAFEVTGFNNATGWSSERRIALAQAHAEGLHFSRTEPLDMYVFKHFDETLREGRRGLGNIGRCVGGNNADSESVELAFNRLHRRTEKRHVMLVMSDGHPAVNTDYPDHLNRHLRQVVANIEAHKNVQLVGLGIKSDAVKKFYPKWCLVEDLEQLSKNVLDQVGRMLLGDRFVVDNSELIGGRKVSAERSAAR